MFDKIYNILVEFLGESKQGGYDSQITQFQFNCPLCAERNGGIPDGKYNLEINMERQKFLCWKDMDTDDMKGNISSLIKKFGTPSLYNKYKEEIFNLKRLKLYDINLYSGITFESQESFIMLPNTFTKLNLSTCNDKRLIEYCNKRKIDQNIINKFNIGYTTWDEKDKSWANRLIIPSYDSFGDLNYFVGRDFTDNPKKTKYKNCSNDKKQIVFQESLIDTDSDVILVEGAIDCIYFPNTISLLGKTLTKDCELYNLLYNKCNGKIIIAIDADTDINETKRIYNILNIGHLKNKIYYIRLNKFKDFGELYEKFEKKGIIKAVHSAKHFNEIDLL